MTLLIVAVCLARLMFMSQAPTNADGANFVDSLRTFDLRFDTPHPPGYLLYVVTGRLCHKGLTTLQAIIPRLPPCRATAAFVIPNVIMSGLIVFLLSALAARYFGPETAGPAAIICLSSPLLWYYSEVPLSYMMGALFGAEIVRAAVAGQRPRYTAYLLGLGGGARIEITLCLWPLVIYYYRHDFRSLIIPFLLGSLTWFIPSALLSGGLLSYVKTVLFQVNTDYRGYQGLPYVKENLIRIYLAVILGLGAFIFVLPFALKRLGLALIWTVPFILFFLVVHMGQPGYALSSIVPALILLAAYGTVVVSNKTRFSATACSLVLAVFNILFFFSAHLLIPFTNPVLASSPSRFVQINANIPREFTRGAIVNHNRELFGKLAYLRKFNPKTTITLTSHHHYDSGSKHILIFAPEYWPTTAPLPPLDSPLTQPGKLSVKNKYTDLILFHKDLLNGYSGPAPQVTEIGGDGIAVIDLTAAEYVAWGHGYPAGPGPYLEVR